MSRPPEPKPTDSGDGCLQTEADGTVQIKIEPELSNFIIKRESGEQKMHQKVNRCLVVSSEIHASSFPKQDQAYYFPYEMQYPRSLNFDPSSCISWNESSLFVKPVFQDLSEAVPAFETDHKSCQRITTDLSPVPPETTIQQHPRRMARQRNTRKMLETPERRAARLAAAAERERQRRANETEQQRRIRREANARRSRLRRATEPEHLRKARLEANAHRARVRRARLAAVAATETVSINASVEKVSETDVMGVISSPHLTVPSLDGFASLMCSAKRVT